MTKIQHENVRKNQLELMKSGLILGPKKYRFSQNLRTKLLPGVIYINIGIYESRQKFSTPQKTCLKKIRN